jgi:hypothetical protein
VFSIAVWVYVVAHAIATGLMFTAVDSARDFANDSSLRQAFDDAIRPANFFSTITSIAEFTIAVTTFIWTYRITREVTNRGVLLKFSPALCMFSWLLPPVLFIFPLIVLRDLVTKTKTIPLVMAFFGAALTSALPESDQDLARSLSEQIVPNTISALSLIAAALMWRRIVNTLSTQLEI